MPPSLGLQRGIVRLAPPDAAWADAFESERTRLAEALAGIAYAIHHVGSTSVPGLTAKPILDLAMGVDEADALVVRPPLEALGYEYRGDGGDDGGHLFVLLSAPQVRTHHLHVVRTGDPQLPRWLRLRDHLRVSASARERYARAKRDLAARHPDDRRAYTEGKTAIIRALLAEASA